MDDFTVPTSDALPPNDALTELLMQAFAGDPRAWCQIIERTWDPLRLTVLPLLANAEEAKDVVQQTYLRALQYQHRFNAERCRHGGALAWLRQIALNLARSVRRTTRRRGSHESLGPAGEGRTPRDVADPDPLTDPAVRSEAEEEAERRKQRVQKAVKKLPPDLARLVKLRYFLHKSYKQIRKLTGYTQTALANKLHRARQILRSLLS